MIVASVWIGWWVLALLLAPIATLMVYALLFTLFGTPDDSIDPGWCADMELTALPPGAGSSPSAKVAPSVGILDEDIDSIDDYP